MDGHLDIRGVIFDLDGVLIHSTDFHRQAFEQTFRELGIYDFEYEPYAGWRTGDVVREALYRRGLPADEEKVAEAARQKTRIARDLIDRSKPVAPGAEMVLAMLAASYPLGLASSGSRASVNAFLKMTGAASLFRSTLSGSDVSRAKPDPEIYRRSAASLGLRAQDCLVVEDSTAGIAAARAAGAVPMGVDPRGDRLLEAAGAIRTLRQICELPALLPLERSTPVDPALWTAIVPAAGRGSRLGFHRPKIMYPVAGRPILDWLLDFLNPNCSALVFVLSPDGAGDVTAELQRRIPGRFEVVVQETPTGMGDAVKLALPRVRTRHAAIVWGDQVALRRASVETCLRLHQGPLQAQATVPTVIRRTPYIHFEREERGAIVKLRQAREGDAMPPEGESDTGFFCFQADALRSWLDELERSGEGFGGSTGERNLLPVILLAARHGRLLTPRCVQPEETVGVNSAPDAWAVEQFLQTSHAQD